MRKPNWKAENGDECQWPKCSHEGTIHFAAGSNRWVVDGVWVCDKHLRTMSEELWPDLNLPFTLHTEQVHIAAFEDYPREAVYIHDWYKSEEGIVLLVGEEQDTPTDDCQEVMLDMIEEMDKGSETPDPK
jgi:hypothetical protein